MSENVTFEVRLLPPPEVPPKYATAQALGLVGSLRVTTSERQFRCASCDKMQRTGSPTVWVPDSVRRKDPAWSVEEACRLNSMNGSFSGWCVACAPKQGRPLKRRKTLLERLGLA